MRALRALALAAILALAGGCGSGGGSERGLIRQGGAYVVTGEQLQAAETDLLTQLHRRVPGIRVGRGSDACPVVILRNAASAISPENAQVYVDGTLSLSTCILESLRATDIDRVEVYSSGTTRRPGYPRHPHGLILVFTRGALPPPT